MHHTIARGSGSWTGVAKQAALLAAARRRLVERFLLDNYRPHQLSTYALTLYQHQFKTPEGRDIPVGAPLVACLASSMRCSSVVCRSDCTVSCSLLPTRCPCRTLARCLDMRVLGGGCRHSGTAVAAATSRIACSLYCALLRLLHRRPLGHGGPGAVQQPALVVLLPRPRLRAGLRRDAQSDLQEPRTLVSCKPASVTSNNTVVRCHEVSPHHHCGGGRPVVLLLT